MIMRDINGLGSIVISSSITFRGDGHWDQHPNWVYRTDKQQMLYRNRPMSAWAAGIYSAGLITPLVFVVVISWLGNKLFGNSKD